MKIFITIIVVFLSSFGFGQAWSGIMSSSRAIDWTHAGLPATLPDGETTANPWTPPIGRTLCTTLSPSGGDDVSQINTAVSGCAAKTYVLLNTGTWHINSGLFLGGTDTSGHNYVTVRGNGPMNTIIQMGAAGQIAIGRAVPNSRVALTASPSQGATSVAITSTSGLVNGQIAWLEQCDNGISGATCATGTHTDTGGLYFCGYDVACNSDTSGSGTNATFLERQYVLVTSIVGNTVHFTPGLYLPNWSTTQTAGLVWQNNTWQAYGMGLENLTIVETYNASIGSSFSSAYASWIYGVRIIFMGNSSNNDITISGLAPEASKNNLVANNYIDNPPDGVIQEIFSYGWDSDDLILNNIIEGGTMVGTGSTSGTVIAYNFIHDSWTGQPYGNFQHQPGSYFTLMEGNTMPRMSDDDTWGSHTLNTFARNNFPCWDAPWTGGAALQALTIQAYARFENAIGNVLGYLQGASPICTAYESVTSPYNFSVNFGNTPNNPNDSLTAPSLFRWANYVVCTGNSHCNNASNFDAAENPTTLTAAAATYNNLVSPSTTIPASLFLGVTAHPSGGTGLGWWKVCTSWTTFPTCSGSQIQPFPPIGGSDVTGGRADAAGHAYDIPAAVAYKNLPIDATFQQSFTVTSSNWSGGTETLTVTGLPSAMMGGFQLTGAAAGCSVGGNTAYSPAELSMTAANATTISYALTPNPGVSCTGTVKWPNVRQFDATVFASDPLAGSSTTPSSLMLLGIGR